MAVLDGSGSPIQITSDITITAPGLVGSAEAIPPRSYVAGGAAVRGGERATVAYDLALSNSGFEELTTIEMDVRQEAPPPDAPDVRTSQGEAGLVLETPDLGERVGQVVMAVDEDGVVTWTFPEDETGRQETPAMRGAGGRKRFVIRQATPEPAPGTESADRGIIGAIGRKFLKVLIYPVADKLLGGITEHFARNWETENRPYKVRSFAAATYNKPIAGKLASADWHALAGGRALLFVHGTFSSTHSGFGSLPVETVTALNERYGDRVFSFDHHTLSATPEENVAEFAKRMPDNVRLDVDIVSHSRGGLVARTFAGELGSGAPGLSVQRAVFVATPNHGTPLANADHMIDFIDRYTSVLNLLPPGPLDVVGEILEAILTVVKMLGHAVLNGLGGLSSMDPQGDFIGRINSGQKPSAGYYALAADYEPTGGLRDLVKKGVADTVLDKVFEDAANDLVVPTLGVYQGSADPAFPIPSDNLHAFPKDAGISHTRFFAEPGTSNKLLEWLVG